MSSSDRIGGHLDAFAGREVVYCHSCDNEWYKDEHDLICPRCGGEAVEIITHENDPRDIPEPVSPSGFEGGGHPFPFDHHHHDSDSDPGEADIDEHIREGPGYTAYQTTWNQPRRQRGPEGRRPVDATSGDAILQRFTEMLMHDFGAANRSGPPGRSGPETLFPPPRIHQTTFTSQGLRGGTATFTIATGPIRRSGPGEGPPDFDLMFGNIMNNVPPPDVHDPDNPQPGNRAGGPPPGFPATLQHILGMFLNPAGAVHGDAVYSQEALDRIISQLMEQNQMSNAAPPATQDAINNLQRKKVDDALLGPEGKVECTICISEVEKGEEVAVLPCKHWFHSECVVMWLKEHNTCPVCRHPIEGGNNGGNSAQQPASQMPEPGPAFPTPMSQSPFTTSRYRQRDRPARSPSDNQERLDSIRDAAGLPGQRGTPSSFGGVSGHRGTPTRDRDPRRSSLSPPSPRDYSSLDQSTRMRHRSPSPGRDRGQSHHDSSRNSGSGHGAHGVFNSLRNRFFGSDSSGQNGRRRS